MPIKERLLRGLEGFEESQPLSTPSTPQPRASGGPNPYIRCPIPPLNANSDTLRQFDEGGSIPSRRVIPLPVSVSGGGGTLIQNTTVVAPSAGGGGGTSGGTTSLTATSVTMNVPALAPNTTYTTKISMAKAFQLLQVTASQPLELRMYGSSLSQGADISRPTDTSPAFTSVTGLITNVVFDTSPYQWAWQNRVAANADNPQTSDIYVTIISPASAGISPATITIMYLPLEV